MAIYTRGGDQGMTSLRGGERVSKGSLQVAVLGELDELNCSLGFGVGIVESLGRVYQEQGDEGRAEELEKVIAQIREVQGELLELGAAVARVKLQPSRHHASGSIEHLEQKTKDAVPDTQVPEANKWVARSGRFETWIDDYEKSLPELRNFILPGGGVGGGALHVCRAVLRRVERTTVRLVQSSGGGGRQIAPEFALGWLPYLNRLGDWLFVCARMVAWISQEPEGVWEGEKQKQV